MVSLIFAHLLSILLVGGLRFGPGAVVPGGSRTLWLFLLGLAGIGILLAMRRELSNDQAPWRSRGRILLWLVFPGGSTISWGLGQPDLVGGLELPMLALILGAVIAMLIYRHSEWTRRWVDPAAWSSAVRWLVLPTAAGLIFGLAQDTPGAGLGWALATYPVYAFGQLAAALVLPWTQWARDGIRPAWRVAATSLLFAMIHWPNPFATVAAGAGMLLFALAWRAGSALVPIAISMGALAAVVTQTLPDSLTAHMRVGANYVLQSDQRERESWLDREAHRINRLAAWSDAEGLRPWLSRAFAEINGGPMNDGLVEGTALSLERLHRQSVVRYVFHSAEFRRRHGIEEALQNHELRFFESTFVPHHAAHARYVSFVDECSALSTREFVRRAYVEFLGREAAEREYRYWPEPVSARVRWEFLRRVLDGGSIRSWRVSEEDASRERLRALRGARSP
jgi:hypothetical protein